MKIVMYMAGCEDCDVVLKIVMYNKACYEDCDV